MLEAWKGVVSVDWMITVVRLLYDAAYLVAILLMVVLMEPVEAVKSLGPGSWGLSALWFVLLLLDWTGRVNLHGEMVKLLSALILPAVLGSGELLFRDEVWGTASFYPIEVYTCFCLLFLLLANTLFRGPDRKEELLLTHRAELFLERGCELGIAYAAWLILLSGAVAFVAVFGLLLVVLLGEIVAQNSSLFDFGGVAGVLLGLLVLCLAQAVMFWRGFRLAKEKAPALVGPWSSLLLWIPVINLVWASRLKHRLWGFRMEKENPLWTEL